MFTCKCILGKDISSSSSQTFWFQLKFSIKANFVSNKAYWESMLSWKIKLCSFENLPTLLLSEESFYAWINRNCLFRESIVFKRIIKGPSLISPLSTDMICYFVCRMVQCHRLVKHPPHQLLQPSHQYLSLAYQHMKSSTTRTQIKSTLNKLSWRKRRYYLVIWSNLISFMLMK